MCDADWARKLSFVVTSRAAQLSSATQLVVRSNARRGNESTVGGKKKLQMNVGVRGSGNKSPATFWQISARCQNHH